MDRPLILTLVLVVHLTAAVLHGYSHALVPVQLPISFNVIVLLTVFAGPTVGFVLVKRRHPVGYPLFVASMTAAFLIGGTFHFIVENPDHVSTLPASEEGVLFELSAIAVLVTPAVGALYGTMCWKSQEGK